MCIRITEKIFAYPKEYVVKTKITAVSIIKLFEKNKQRLRLFVIDLSKTRRFFNAEDARTFKKYDKYFYEIEGYKILEDYLVPAHFSRRRMTNFLLLAREFDFII